jgi:hypothetical protein
MREKHIDGKRIEENKHTQRNKGSKNNKETKLFPITASCEIFG